MGRATGYPNDIIWSDNVFLCSKFNHRSQAQTGTIKIGAGRGNREATVILNEDVTKNRGANHGK